MSSLSSELTAKIRRIQIISTQLAKEALAGVYHSAFKGRGMEFEEVREYQSGDDIRSIDWNVTARMNHPYVKNFREERDLKVILLVDVSASTRFGGGNTLKSELIAEIGAVLAFSAIRNNDRVGLLLFSDCVEKYIPPRKGTRHVLRMIRELLAFKPKHRGSNLETALAFLGKVQVRSSICFLISDFLLPDCSRALSLTAAKHDLIGLCITDPREYTLPAVGLIDFKDLETGRELVVDSSNTLSTLGDFKNQQKKAFNKIGADFVDIRTDFSYMTTLRKFFKIRGERHK